MVRPIIQSSSWADLITGVGKRPYTSFSWKQDLQTRDLMTKPSRASPHRLQLWQPEGRLVVNALTEKPHYSNWGSDVYTSFVCKGCRMDMTNNQRVVIVVCLPQCTVNCKAKKQAAKKRTKITTRVGAQPKLKNV